MDTDATPNSNQPDAMTGIAKKYIRTFAGDMAAIQKGDKPDLSPLAESQPTAAPAERLVEESSLPPVSAQPTEEPPPAPIPTEQNPPAGGPKPIPLQTYSGDFSDKMKEEKASPITVLAAEQDAGKQKFPDLKPRFSRSSIVYIIAGVVLLIAGGIGVYFAYERYAASIAPVILAPIISAPISVDERQEISGTGTVLLNAVKQSVDKQIASGSIRFLYTVNATTTGSSVFSALQLPAPSVLLRNLNADGSMTGVVNVSGNQSPFFLLSVASYSDTFSGMLSWEHSMAADLAELYPSFGMQITSTSTATSTPVATTTSKIAPKIIPKTSATSTAASSASVTVAGFRDEIIGNHDVRIYRDSAGRSILLYGYWNQKTLIIARNPSAFIEILNRLVNSHT